MVQLAAPFRSALASPVRPALFLVREDRPAYGDAPCPPDDESDVIEALGDEIATLAAHMVRGCQTTGSR